MSILLAPELLRYSSYFFVEQIISSTVNKSSQLSVLFWLSGQYSSLNIWNELLPFHCRIYTQLCGNGWGYTIRLQNASIVRWQMLEYTMMNNNQLSTLHITKCNKHVPVNLTLQSVVFWTNSNSMSCMQP